ncbi:NACHT domain-containing protein [Rhizobium ruizarguesonis]|uniref:hypothetical protein n=2 Tax=Rhizobium ruizarguesonis TaxID=2081791 RepID=UPI0013B803C8|nr:hypothetical protein [Rhizobium ruizarguesonis]MBY5842692.1 hypothetical protein [Rhizobium leguminosarum]NEH84187.1 hypothetical protein [Rhizobium ruizarguesonis]NEJ63275.1 hypothetical protein [Rhizobium ruizarguesonis]
MMSYQPTAHLSRDQIDILVSRWFAQIKAEDVDGSIAAIEFLRAAPDVFSKPAVEKLRHSDRLEKVFEAADSQQKSRLRNSQIVNQFKLRDLLWRDHLEMLQAALAEKTAAATTTVLSLIAGINAMQELPPPLAEAYVNALLDDGLDDQVRTEIAGLLRGHWSALKAQSEMFKTWLRANVTGSPAAEVRRQVALSVLARLELPLSADEIDAVATQNPADFLAVVRHDPKIAHTHAEQLFDILGSVNDAEVWTSAYTVLQQADPDALSAFYAGMTQELAMAWNPGVLDRFIRSATTAQAAAFKTWDASGDNLDCDGLRWRLSLLQRQRTPRNDRFAKAWDLLTKKVDCRDDLSMEVDDALTAIAGPALPDLLLAAVDKDGPGQLKFIPVVLRKASAALGGTLAGRLIARDLPAAARLLDTGIVPPAEQLAQSNYWEQVFAAQSADTVDVVDLRALQAVDSPPTEALVTAKGIVLSDQASVSRRTAALMALGAHAAPKDKVETFLPILYGNAAIALPTIKLLAETYDTAKTNAALSLPDTQTITDMRTNPDVSKDAVVLAKTLVRFDATLARDYADALDSQGFATEPADQCLTLAQAPTVDPRLLAPLLAIAASNGNASERDVVLSCVATLSKPGSATAMLAQGWRAPALLEPTSGLAALKSLWTDEPFHALMNPDLEVKIGQVAGRLLQNAPLSTETMAALDYWRDEIAAIDPAQAQTLSTELNKRRLYAALILVPSAVVVHLFLWLLLVTAYPRFPWVQAVVFWNPVIRRLLGLGYIDIVLLHVGYARRKIFSPFKASLLGDIVSDNPSQLDRISYFPNSLVWHRPAVDSSRNSTDKRDQPILQALARHKGRVLLLGKSGLGKSSFLRFSLAARAKQGIDVIVYLRADQCRNGVEAQLQDRLGGLAKGNDLLSAMIYAGRIFIYIDGYNEVDLATQDAITGFLSRYPVANVLVASQIPLRGFTTIETFEMIPLTGEAIGDFLLSREPVLADNAPVRGTLFETVARSFLADVHARPRDDVEKKAFEDILSNPMDLTSVAILLGDGRTPDLFALEAQQLDGIAQKLAATGQRFRTEALSKALLEQRLQDQENLQTLPFQPEVAALVRGKLAIVRTDADDASTVKGQEIRFRHDRIRDYFTHFALLALPLEKQAEFAEDTRFAGVFPYLARALPKNDAEDLRERLVTRAADLEDHRVSDSFVREYSWRQKISAQDPDWLPGYDLPEVRRSDTELVELTTRRRTIDEEVNARRDLITKSRAMTRVLAASDPNFLRDAAVAIFVEMGATIEAGDDGALRALLRSPADEPFRVVGLCQPQAIKSFHVEVLVARFTRSNLKPLIMTNSHSLEDPETRGEDLERRDCDSLEALGARVISARELYGVFARLHGQGSREEFWQFVFPTIPQTETRT